jgi:hypothetical protein
MVLHPVHVSLLSIDYAPEGESFNVFLRVYFDDFLLDSGISSADQNKLKFPDQTLFTEGLLERYLNEKLLIAVNGKPVAGKIRNTDLSENELRMNLVFSPVNKINTVTVKNLILTSIYSDQANMTILKVNDYEQGIKLTAAMTEMTFEVN